MASASQLRVWTVFHLCGAILRAKQRQELAQLTPEIDLRAGSPTARLPRGGEGGALLPRPVRVLFSSPSFSLRWISQYSKRMRSVVARHPERGSCCAGGERFYFFDLGSFLEAGSFFATRSSSSVLMMMRLPLSSSAIPASSICFAQTVLCFAAQWRSWHSLEQYLTQRQREHLLNSLMRSSCRLQISWLPQ